MFVTRRLSFIMLALLVLDEGFLLTIVSCSSDIINADDGEQLHPAMLPKQGEISKANISKRSAMQVGNFSSYFQGQFDSSCSKCGLVNKGGNFMIVRGDVVRPPYKYPWMVRLQIGYGSLCGGSIISANYILTAAHCVDKTGPRGVTVLFLTSTHSLTRGPAVQRIILHPQWNLRALKHDIALLKLQNPIKCDKFKNPICLPHHNTNVPVGTTCIASGWGLTQPGPRGETRELREGKMKLVNYSKCAQTYGRSNARNEYCFEGLSSNWQSICMGDSGGPAFYESAGRYVQVGIASATSQGCRIGYPSMLTAVPTYINWIKQNTGSSF